MCFMTGFKSRQRGGQPNMQQQLLPELGGYTCKGIFSPVLQPGSQDHQQQLAGGPERPEQDVVVKRSKR